MTQANNVRVLEEEEGFMPTDVEYIKTQLQQMLETQNRLEARLSEINDFHQKEVGAQAYKEQQVAELRKEVEQNERDIKSLSNTLTEIRGGVRAMKWMAAMVGIGGTTAGAAVNSFLAGLGG